MYLYCAFESAQLNPGRWISRSDSRTWRTAAGSNSAIIRKRVLPPYTFLHTAHEQMVIGYSSQVVPVEFLLEASTADFANLEPVEFLVIRQRGHIVDMFNSGHGTLPVFIIERADGLVLGNGYNRLLSEAKLRLSQFQLFKHLLPTQHDHHTYFENVRLLPPNSHAVWEDGQLTIRKLTKFPAQHPSNPRDFPVRLEQTVQTSLETYGLAHAAFEVSGGIDSATVPLVAHRADMKSRPLATMHFPGRFGSSQQRKIDALTHALNASTVGYRIVREPDFPLARFMSESPATRLPFYQAQEIYTEIVAKLANRLHRQGIQTLYTGIGGDELFEAPLTARDVITQTLIPEDPPNFFTQQAVKAIKRLNQQPPLLLPVDSTVLANWSRNNLYIEQGIWPVAPLADVQLRSYTQALPRQFRDNKNILRAYYEAHDFPTAIYQAEANEHFGELFEWAMQHKLSGLAHQLMPGGWLERMNLIDSKCFIDSFEEAIRAAEPDPRLYLGLFAAISAELNLSHLAQRNQVVLPKQFL